jgi:hypothetical protein
MPNLFEQLWQTYTQSWSETDPDKRLQMYPHVLDENCHYSDPLIETQGFTQLSNYMGEFQKKFPGGRFVTTHFLSHHQHSLAHWDMLDQNGNIIQKGYSFGWYNSDNKLRQLSAFFELAENP